MSRLAGGSGRVRCLHESLHAFYDLVLQRGIDATSEEASAKVVSALHLSMTGTPDKVFENNSRATWRHAGRIARKLRSQFDKMSSDDDPPMVDTDEWISLPLAVGFSPTYADKRANIITGLILGKEYVHDGVGRKI